MKKILLIVAPLILSFLVIGTTTLFLAKGNGKGALQVTSIPKSKAYLNGKELGETPLCVGPDAACKIQEPIAEGSYSFRLVPTDRSFSPFEQKITIRNSIMTVVDYTFGQGATSQGSILTFSSLERKQDRELLVISFPDNADVFLDNTIVGKTPLLLKDITESDHELKLTKNGYTDKSIRIKTKTGYKLEATVFLGIDTTAALPVATSSAQLDPQSSPSATPTQKPTGKVKILQTPNGFLRVRESGSLQAAEITRVTPGEIFDYIDEVEGWYSIKLPDGRIGWVSSQFSQKQ